MEFSRPNTGVGCLSLLQGSSQSRDQTQVSLIAGIFFKPMHFEKDLREPGLDEGRLGWKSVCVKDKVLDQDKVSWVIIRDLMKSRERWIFLLFFFPPHLSDYLSALIYDWILKRETDLDVLFLRDSMIWQVRTHAKVNQLPEFKSQLYRVRVVWSPTS